MTLNGPGEEVADKVMTIASQLQMYSIKNTKNTNASMNATLQRIKKDRNPNHSYGGGSEGEAEELGGGFHYVVGEGVAELGDGTETPGYAG